VCETASSSGGWLGSPCISAPHKTQNLLISTCFVPPQTVTHNFRAYVPQMIRLHNPFSSLISSVLLTLLVGRWERNLSVCFNGHFPGGPGLAGTRMFPFWILLELRVIEVVVTTGAISLSNHHHQQTNMQFFYTPVALPVTQPTVSKH